MAVTQDQLYELYLAYFGRPPDFDGLQFYTANPDFTVASVAAAFSASPESQALYGTSFGAAQVDAIYMNLFNRHAEPAGLAYWTTEVASGRLTPAGAALAILQGAQNDDKVAVQNKLAIAHAFVAELDTSEEIIGYSGPIAAAAARAFLHTVDWTPGSLSAAQAGLDGSVADVVGVGGPPGQTFVLTTGVDHITGTAGNDVIEAVPASGSSTTLNAFDTIDGGGGTDTLNIYTTFGVEISQPNSTANAQLFVPGANTIQQGTIKNVEIVNVYNDQDYFGVAGEVGEIDASKFQGLQQLWQRGDNSSDVFNATAGVLFGFSDVTGFLSSDIEATVTTTTLNFDLVNIKGTKGGHLDVLGDALTTVAIAGGLDGAAHPYLVLDATAGIDASTFTVNTQGDTEVRLHENGDSTKALRTLDASGSTGNIYFNAQDSQSFGYDISTIKTGSGDDFVDVTAVTVKDDPTTTADETVTATVSTGAGDDRIDVYVNYDGPQPVTSGALAIDAGDGDDDVSIFSRGAGKLTANLGAGDDSFRVVEEIQATLVPTPPPLAINGTDAIDGGAGTDTLQLRNVGSSNVGAFSNFEVFDAVDLARTLDIDILASKNTVTEIIASADVGPGAGLLNLGAGVGYRATADLGSSDSMSLTQKTAGALTVTQDVDQLPAEAVGELQFSSMAVKATNATALTAVFDNQSVDPVHASIFLMGDKASSLAIVSGGGASDGTYENYINYSVGLGAATAGPDGLLKSITVTGDQHLILAISANATESNLATIDATAFKSVLYTGLDALKDGGTIALGADTTGVIRVNGVTSNAAGMESISGFGKAAAAAFDVAPSQAAIDAADTLNLKAASGLMADTVTPDAANLNVSVSKGVATFGGTGPSTLMEALTAIDAHDAAGSGDTVVLQYIGDTYVFVEGGTVGLADDVVIKLTGLTGVSKAAFATNGLIVG